MNLQLTRFLFGENATIGKLSIDNTFFCYTLEDTVRPVGIKIKGQTAIPAGYYEVIIDFSNRFQRRMPHILNVRGFDGIRIHSGNTDKDTEGCILLGMNYTAPDFVGESHVAFEVFFPKLSSALLQGKVFITIV